MIWSGITSADSLQVRYELAGSPDKDGIGNQLLRVAYSSSGNQTVTTNMPEGAYIYFGLLSLSGGTWSQTATDSLYVQDFARAFPRAASYFTGTIVAGSVTDSLSVFDLAVDVDHDITGDSASIFRHDTLQINNPEILIYPHGYTYWDILQGWAGDSISMVVSDSIFALLESDSLPVWTTDTTTILEGITSGGGNITVTVNDASEIHYDAGWPQANRMAVMLYKRGTPDKYEIFRVDNVWDESGTGSDSLNLKRLTGARVYRNNATWSNGDTLYVFDSVWHHVGGSELAGHAHTLGTGDDAPAEMRARITGRVVSGIRSRRTGTPHILDGFMFDTYWRNHLIYRPGNKSNFAAAQDSTFIKAAGGFQAAVTDSSSDLDLSVNVQMDALQGFEDSLVNVFLLGESDMTSATRRYINGHDLLYEQYLPAWDATRYRYGMRSDNWPPYRLTNDYDGNTADGWRFHAALSTIFGAFSAKKQPFKSGRSPWIDEFWVGSSDSIAKYSTTLDSDRWWLGWPTEPVQYITKTNANPDKVSNGGFEAGTAGWGSSNTDSVGIATSSYWSASGDSSLRMTVNVGYRPYTSTGPFNERFGHYVYYDNNFNVRPTANYTLSFTARANASRIIGVRLYSSGLLYTAAVHIPETAKTFYIPVSIDTSRSGVSSDTTDVQIQFGLTPIQLPDTASTVYLDDVSLKEGIGFAGYSRKFDNGLVLVNVRDQAVWVDLADNVYHKIGASGNPWADGAHNDSSVVADSIQVPANDAYFLIGSEADDTTPPDPVLGLTTQGIGVDTIAFVWQAVDSTDAVGYNLRLSTTGNPTDPDSGAYGAITYSRLDTTATVSGLTEATTYYASVFARDEVPNYSSLVAGSMDTVTTQSELFVEDFHFGGYSFTAPRGRRRR